MEKQNKHKKINKVGQKKIKIKSQNKKINLKKEKKEHKKWKKFKKFKIKIIKIIYNL